MNTKPLFWFLIITLVVLGGTSIYLRHTQVGIPLLPKEQIDVWQIEAKIDFYAQGGPVKANFTLPNDSHINVLSENTASPAYGMHIVRTGDNQQVQWSKRQAAGMQNLYYQLRFNEKLESYDTEPEFNNTTVMPWPAPYSDAAQAIIDKAYEKSADNVSYMREIYWSLNSNEQNAGLILERYSRENALSYLFSKAELPAKLVYGLPLEHGRRNQKLSPYFKVYLQDQWHLVDVANGLVDDSQSILVWQEDSPALLDLTGARNGKVAFSMVKESQSALTFNLNDLESGGFFDFSIYQMPLAEQNLFRGILLIPVGVLVVVFLRVLVGLRCSGTFMPVLIAMTFIQTTFVNGMIGFVAVVAFGLMIRSYLSSLNLLLVSRIATVVLVVIGIIASFTVIAFKLGLSDRLTVTFFPMIILAWTIERMSILWEEEGPKEVLVQGGGSLIVASCVFFLMDNMLVRHWVFNFLGLHLIIAAVILMLGQYTGYRLLELRRFAPFMRGKEDEDIALQAFTVQSAEKQDTQEQMSPENSNQDEGR